MAAKSQILNLTAILTSTAESIDTCLESQGVEVEPSPRLDGFDYPQYDNDQSRPAEYHVELSEKSCRSQDADQSEDVCHSQLGAPSERAQPSAHLEQNPCLSAVTSGNNHDTVDDPVEPVLVREHYPRGGRAPPYDIANIDEEEPCAQNFGRRIGLGLFSIDSVG